MTELGWVTVDGKRVLPVNSNGTRCSTSSSPASKVSVPHVLCCFYGDCPSTFCMPHARERGAPTMFIDEEQLPAYLALRLEGLAP